MISAWAGHFKFVPRAVRGNAGQSPTERFDRQRSNSEPALDENIEE